MRIPALRRPSPVWITPLLSTSLFYFILSSFSSGWFAQWLHPIAEPLDFAVDLLIGYALFCISRRIWAFLIVQGVLMGVLYIGNAVMIRFFEKPVAPADVNSFGALVKVLPTLQLMYLLVPLTVMVVLFLWNLRPHLGRWIAFCILLGIPVSMVLLFPATYVRLVDAYRGIGYQSWDQLEDYLNRGPVVYFAEAAARTNLVQSPPPIRAAVVATLHALPDPPDPARDPRGTKDVAKPNRNVYIILVESFWDPAALTAAGLNRDPWPPALRELWAKTGYSRALSPVFGHGTANAEFEMLCGEPALTAGIVFVSELTKPLPCLPRFLAKHGYTTIAQHPNMMNFWNRVTAYRYVGFQRYYSKKDFVLDELDASYLSDSSLFPQARQHVQKLAGGKPHLDYIMTLAGHYPYKLNQKIHPDVITTTYKRGFVGAEVNSIYYTAKALLTHIQNLRASDPDAVIVVAGDHLPSYGTGFDVYAKSGLFPRETAKSTPEQLENRLGTPLIVINGRRGPVSLGTIPMYEVPAHILRMLGYPAKIFGAFEAGDGLHMRPYEGSTLVVNDNGPSAVCHPGMANGVCGMAAAWNVRVNTLSTDLLAGSQYAVRLLMGGSYTLQEPHAGFAYIPPAGAKPCKIDVVAWGPKSTRKGHGFNVQKSGASAFWVRISKASSDVKLRLNGHVLKTARGPGLLTAGVNDLGIVPSRGEYPLDAVCRYAPGVAQIGTFVVR